MSDLGQIIKTRREDMNLSQKKLSAICQISDSEINKIEKGTRKTPSWINLCKIAAALKFHPFDLLLEAGYISKEDIHPNTRLHGLESLSDTDIQYLQLLIDFIISKKPAAFEGG